jgi:hypothetical protein
VFELLVKYLVEPTKNPTSKDSAVQRIDDNFHEDAVHIAIINDMSARNFVKYFLFRVAYFSGDKTLNK